jgi:hypothetical protein
MVGEPLATGERGKQLTDALQRVGQPTHWSEDWTCDRRLPTLPFRGWILRESPGLTRRAILGILGTQRSPPSRDTGERLRSPGPGAQGSTSGPVYLTCRDPPHLPEDE